LRNVDDAVKAAAFAGQGKQVLMAAVQVPG